jgi:hypothetical protein
MALGSIADRVLWKKPAKSVENIAGMRKSHGQHPLSRNPWRLTGDVCQRPEPGFFRSGIPSFRDPESSSAVQTDPGLSVRGPSGWSAWG